MCDTLGLISGSFALFGKNSDRSPNEAQITEYYPARIHDEEQFFFAEPIYQKIIDDPAVFVRQCGIVSLTIDEFRYVVGDDAIDKADSTGAVDPDLAHVRNIKKA